MGYTAEIVTATTADGLTLYGGLQRPAGDNASTIGVDVMIMHHGVGGNFYRSTMFDHLAEHLLAAGCAVLRVNNRGHDLMSQEPRAGQQIRVGAAFESVADCVHDWRAWVDCAAAQGFSRIGVWGHSLGGVKTIFTFATAPDPRVAYAIASSPPRFAYETYVAGPDGPEFRQQFEVAQALVDRGEGQTLVDITQPTRSLLAASTIVDKYGPPATYDFMRHLPNIALPFLVTVGGLEATGPQRIAFADHEPLIGGLARTQANLAFTLVPGADHFYSGCEAALWHDVQAWVARLGA